MLTHTRHYRQRGRRTDPLALALSALLDDHREHQGYSAQALARAAHLAENTVRYVLDGQTTSTYTLHALTRALGLVLTIRKKHASVGAGPAGTEGA